MKKIAFLLLDLLLVVSFGCNLQKGQEDFKSRDSLFENWYEGYSQELGSPLPGTDSLTWIGPIDKMMRDGINEFLDRKTKESENKRARHWSRDFSSNEAYEKSVEPNRERLKEIIGAVDLRTEVEMSGLENDAPLLVSDMPDYTIYEIQWPAIEHIPDLTYIKGVKQTDWEILSGPVQIKGEGLLLKPKGTCRGYVIVVPDSDQTPEQLAGLSSGINIESQISRRLAENGFCVISPVLLSRDTLFSKGVKRNQRTHRDWIYTPAFEIGRHPIGYEVQKIYAAVDWCIKNRRDEEKIAIAGYGEGGQVAMYSAATDTRIDATLISGYFNKRDSLWHEPLYRNIWGLLEEFGDAEIATLIAPRKMIVEYSVYPEWKRNVDNTGPGELNTPAYNAVSEEFARIDELIPNFGSRTLISNDLKPVISFGSQSAIIELASALGVNSSMNLSKVTPFDNRKDFDPRLRQERMVKQMENFTQLIMRNSEYYRDSQIFTRLSFQSLKKYNKSADLLRKEFQTEHIGWFDEPILNEINPRSRKIYDEEKWIGYDVVLDTWPKVFAWGVLCIPKDIRPGEKRPVVICQHGLEGTPYSTIDSTEDYRYYKSFTAKLAEQGFITFAPHNLYRGGNEFRVMQRKANPLKASLFSIITPQHSQILNFLVTLPFVDKDRIGFYGLSYGGKSAMRIPAIETRYKLSICSGDFNEWVRINADVHFPTAYMYRGSEYEMVEWDLGHSFNYAEMTYLIAPRPFMVERGHFDGVGIDQWVNYEFSRARRVYDLLGIGNSCEIEYFDGPHTINGKGTFSFIQRELMWPEKKGYKNK